MARSSYVYMVKVGLGVVGCFTVKHELVSACEWWIRQGGDKALLTILRTRDGLREFGGAVDITDQIRPLFIV